MLLDDEKDNNIKDIFVQSDKDLTDNDGAIIKRRGKINPGHQKEGSPPFFLMLLFMAPTSPGHLLRSIDSQSPFE